ncbi:MAG: DNA mismatch repair endonuclease MutL [Lewinella sp.]|nr:DNA mismatch repair endonuclease MutL [Lewinella sp.]
MADIIQLLPDAIANQIAAGEVIQRPASVVKELMENAIDAGASTIKLVIKDSGSALIQVIDNGCGMSETDARMSFERHATSKIRYAEDLFAIRTMGFRGEALASVAAVAQVEMRTRRHADELGTRIQIDGSEIKAQESCQCSAGTTISIKNLFFNLPARRNFLKSPTVEMKHILDEFQRIALANPDIFFSLHHNSTEVFHLPPGNLRQRIVGVFGTTYNKKLVPVQETTDLLKVYGFVGKPEFAKKARGEQFFFVNQRFIRSNYLHHAVMTAFEDILKDAYPFYVIFLDIDPSQIDINVHPTKQEIKFDDEKLVYNYLKVAIRHSLGQFSVMPTLDFDQEGSFSAARIAPPSPAGRTIESYTRSSGMDSANPASAGKPPHFQRQERHDADHWQSLYEGLDEADPGAVPDESPEGPITIKSKWADESALDDASGSFSQPQKAPYQIHATYIVSPIKSGFLLIDQQAAHERILFEKYLDALEKQETYSQRQLFPRTISLPPADAAVLKEISRQINQLGFDVQEFGANTFVINGVPADMAGRENEAQAIEDLLAQYKANLDMKLDLRENIARAMARSTGIKRGQILTVAEMQGLIDKLFACSVPFKSPYGRHCFLTFELDELARRFES